MSRLRSVLVALCLILPLLGLSVPEAAAQPSFCTGEKSLAAQVYRPGIRLVTTRLPRATGGTGRITYSLSPKYPDGRPALPDGLDFDATDRTIIGWPTAEQVATEYTYTATDSATPPQSTSLTFTLAVQPVAFPRSVLREAADVRLTQVYAQNVAIDPLVLPAAEQTATAYTYTATDDRGTTDTTDDETATLTFNITVEADAATADKTALLALYDATRGACWTRNTNWGSENDLDDWLGVDTNDDGRVTHVRLQENELTGPLPGEVGVLSSLEVLQLRNNQLVSLPKEVGDLTNLTQLILMWNRLSSLPAELGKLTNLTQLYLHTNQLSGPIPAELGDLTSLIYLGLDHNAATLCLPPELRALYNSTKPIGTVSLCSTVPPGGLTVTPVAGEPGRLRARWTAPANPDFAINGYHVEYSLDAGTTWTGRRTVTGGGATLSGLPAESYRVRVRAVGESPDNPDTETNHLGTLWSMAAPVGGAVTVTPATLTVAEAGGTASYDIVLTAQPTGDVSVALDVSGDTTAVTVQPSTVTFTPGNWNTAQTLTVTGVDNEDIDTPNRTATLTHDARGGGYDNTAIVTVTVTDDDAPRVTVTPPVLTVAEAGGEDTYTIVLATEPSDDVTVALASSNTAVVTVLPELLTFTPDTWNTGQDVTVTGVDDNRDTPSREATITHTLSGRGYDNIAGATVTVTVTDDDVARVIVTPTTLTVAEAGGTASYTIVLATEPTDDVIVTPTGTGPVRISPSSLTFTPGTWDTARTVTVTGVNDNLDNPNNRRTATIRHTATSSDQGYTGLAIGSVTVTVTDDDAPRSIGGGSDDSGAAFFEIPPDGSAQSGIGLVSGWACAATSVEVEFIPEAGESWRTEAAYGTDRPDTAGDCGDTNNGFGLLHNWNRLGAGTHEVVLRIDGVVRGRHTVTTLGQEFRRGLSGLETLADFPSAGESVTVEWQEAQQNFVITSGTAPDGSQDTGNGHPEYVVENPAAGSFQSGVSLVSGWACEAATVEVEFIPEAGESWRTEAAYGTERPDTAEVCGDTNNGFGLLHNWNRLGDGTHEVVVRIDGEEVGRRTITVATLGEAFRRGLSGTYTLEDFPGAGERVTVEWQQAQQNFVITDWTGAE